ncbi:b70d805e-7155-4dc3-a660-e744022d15fa [Sclerotinia trifoliorum]|uniref:B70d805e-7155-4dc3-a660-e744022d15fa n=1 Tax=Sclerotinia trifoliorum TaxID=28548 RepID=A0A8H2VMI3_9HELO|nr:b70d805e-7155-4dc3-a660-e744022d15fa [Sclerotinia trifoliorum]
MAPAPATLSDNEKCLIAALNQFASKENKFPVLNNAKLAEDLGLPTPNAARVRWARLTTKIKEGKFGDLKIIAGGGGAGDKNQKRSKDEADFEGNDEELTDVTSPTKKQKSGATRRKACGANGKVKKDVFDECGQEEKFMDGEASSSFNVFEDSDAA